MKEDCEPGNIIFINILVNNVFFLDLILQGPSGEPGQRGQPGIPGEMVSTQTS